VDALNPQILHEVLEKEIKSLIDEKMFNAVIKQEEEDKEKLKRLMNA